MSNKGNAFVQRHVNMVKVGGRGTLKVAADTRSTFRTQWVLKVRPVKSVRKM